MKNCKYDFEASRNPELSRNIISNVFQSLLLVYLLALLGESLWAKSIFNLNYLLVIVILTGTLSALYPPKEHKKEKSILDDPKAAHAASIISGVAGFIIIYYKLNAYSFGLIISIIAGVLIALLSILVLEEENV